MLAAGALALGLAPAAALAAPETTGRLLVTLKPGDRPHSAGALRAAAASLATADGLRLDGAQVPQIGLVSVRPQAGTSTSVLQPRLPPTCI